MASFCQLLVVPIANAAPVISSSFPLINNFTLPDVRVVSTVSITLVGISPSVGMIEELVSSTWLASAL